MLKRMPSTPEAGILPTPVTVSVRVVPALSVGLVYKWYGVAKKYINPPATKQFSTLLRKPASMPGAALVVNGPVLE